jgi:hypothetical protein
MGRVDDESREVIAQGDLGAGHIIQTRKRLRSVKPRNEVGISERCQKLTLDQLVATIGACIPSAVRKRIIYLRTPVAFCGHFFDEQGQIVPNLPNVD